MQALSFTAHIPLVCFGIAFPVMVLLMEYRHGVELRDGRAVAELHGDVRRRLRTRLRHRGVLVLPRGDLPGHLRLRLGPALAAHSGIPIAVTGFLGSWMVISVNAWMNHPSGFRLVTGRVVDAHAWKALFGNDFLWHELIHVYMAGVYAAARLRGRWTRYERAAIVLPLMSAALAAPIQFLAGDWAARTISRDEPTKLAAIEGLAKTTKGAPLHVLGLYEHGQVRYGVRIPKALSVLAFHDPNARVQGLDAVPPWNRPPVNVVRVSFQTMVGIGTMLAILGILTVVVRVR